ncbi:hypothetical protein K470DRAFT_257752 [Piedraia hortae CBS 480.64]|uniref:Prolyl 4-hydroxylase alpha subunit domain-containing protein n=1 Tax=Piedraia hortae CBS 480.64 TaxID=1314780 RepID=A0A6A7C1B3_9PEZI|nr:hypothetical protein K470DRAFT_257752 [Piedraia hortae CBS 480.64]
MLSCGYSEAGLTSPISEESFKPATIHNADEEVFDPSVRNSFIAPLSQLARQDSIVGKTVQCLESRALSFQGWPAHSYIEPLYTQKYVPGGHYSLHYDWGSANKNARRESTFMVYVSASGDGGFEGGGTWFPRLSSPVSEECGNDSQWCEYIECGGQREGVTFRPKAGRAVFWRNFDANGMGYKELIHAGLEVKKGVKVGLNIWTWYYRS